MNQYDMKEDALKRKPHVNIYDYNEKYNRYDLIDMWINDESNNEYHNILIYSENIHIHFDTHDPNFNPSWIKYLFNVADVMLTEKFEFHSQMLYHQHPNDATIKALHRLDQHIVDINVYGFNSPRFDSNLFKQYFNYTFEIIKWKVESTIGTSNSLKQFVLVSDLADA